MNQKKAKLDSQKKRILHYLRPLSNTSQIDMAKVRWWFFALFFLAGIYFVLQFTLSLWGGYSIFLLFGIPFCLGIGLVFWFLGINMDMELGPNIVAIATGSVLALLSILCIIEGLILAMPSIWITSIVFFFMSAIFALFPIFFGTF